MKNSRYHFYAAVGLLVLSIAYLWLGVDAPIAGKDEGALLVYPEQIAHGRLPYRDFATSYPPGNLLVLLGAYLAFGFDVMIERGVALLYQVAILAGIFTLVRRWSLVLAITATMASLLVLKLALLIAYAWWGAMACALWSLILMALPAARWKLALAGLLGGCAMLYRLDFAPAVVVAALPLWLRLAPRDRLLHGAFAVAALLPLLGLSLAAGFPAVFDNLSALAGLHSKPANLLSAESISQVLRWLLFIHLASAALNITASIFEVRMRPNNVDARLFLGFVFLGLAVTYQGLERFDLTHLAFVMIGSISLLPLSIKNLLDRLPALKPWLKLSLPVATVIAMVAVIAWMEPSARALCRVSSTVSSLPLEVKGRSVPLESLLAAKTISRLAWVMERNSRPGERLFVGPRDLGATTRSDVYFYHLFSWLNPASYYLEMSPSSEKRDARLAVDIAGADWLIFNRAYDSATDPHSSGSDKLNEMVRTNFTLRSEFATFLVYERKGRAKPVTPPPTPKSAAQ